MGLFMPNLQDKLHLKLRHTPGAVFIASLRKGLAQAYCHIFNMHALTSPAS